MLLGSMVEGTKIRQPDEFEYVFVLPSLQEQSVWTNGEPFYTDEYNMQGRSQDFSKGGSQRLLTRSPSGVRRLYISLRSWRYCVGARLKFQISLDFIQRFRRQISLDYYTIPPATEANYI